MVVPGCLYGAVCSELKVAWYGTKLLVLSSELCHICGVSIYVVTKKYKQVRVTRYYGIPDWLGVYCLAHEPKAMERKVVSSAWPDVGCVHNISSPHFASKCFILIMILCFCVLWRVGIFLNKVLQIPLRANG